MKRYRLLAAALFAVALAATVAAITIPKVTYTDTRLKNGLRVIISSDRAAPVVSVAVAYSVGSRNERQGRTGFAHLFEHLMFKGSENVADGELAGLIENYGGSHNGRPTRITRSTSSRCRPTSSTWCSFSRPIACGRPPSRRKTSTTSARR